MVTVWPMGKMHPVVVVVRFFFFLFVCFVLFCFVFFFLINIFCKTDLWVTVGNLMVKTQNWEWKSAFNWKSIRQKQNNVRKIITVICITITYVQIKFYIWTVIKKEVIEKYHSFTKFPQMLHIFKNRNF